MHRETPAESRFKAAIRKLACLYELHRSVSRQVNHSTYPSASTIYAELGRRKPSHRSMNGRECRWREQVLKGERHWSYQGARRTFTWAPPEQ